MSTRTLFLRSSSILFFGAVALGGLTGCYRGETKSLDQIFTAAQERFTGINKDGLPGEAATALTHVTGELGKLVSQTGDTNGAVSAIEEDLGTLLPLAGYPVRPALTEVRNEFLEASNGAALNAAQAKLLAFRAYTVLSEELSQGRFQINKS